MTTLHSQSNAIIGAHSGQRAENTSRAAGQSSGSPFLGWRKANVTTKPAAYKSSHFIRRTYHQRAAFVKRAA